MRLHLLGVEAMANCVEAEGPAVVSFHLAGQAFAIDAEYVAEVVPNAWLARPPALPAMVAGLLDLGGEAVTVLRGDWVLGLDEQRFGLDASILILKGTPPRVGLRTGRVDGVRAAQSCRPVTVDAARSFQGSLRGQLVHDGGIINLLDWPRLLGVEERARLDEFRSRAAARLAAWQEAP